MRFPRARNAAADDAIHSRRQPESFIARVFHLVGDVKLGARRRERRVRSVLDSRRRRTFHRLADGSRRVPLAAEEALGLRGTDQIEAALAAEFHRLVEIHLVGRRRSNDPGRESVLRYLQRRAGDFRADGGGGGRRPAARFQTPALRNARHVVAVDARVRHHVAVVVVERVRFGAQLRVESGDGGDDGVGRRSARMRTLFRMARRELAAPVLVAFARHLRTWRNRTKSRTAYTNLFFLAVEEKE